MPAVRFFSLLTLACLAVAAPAGAEWTATFPDGLPIFTTEQRVALQLHDPDHSGPTARLRLLNNLDDEIATFEPARTDVPTTLGLRNPGPGFYRLFDAAGDEVATFGVYIPAERYTNTTETSLCIDFALNTRYRGVAFEDFTEAYAARQLRIARAAGLKFVRERYRPHQILNVPGVLDFAELAGRSPALDAAGLVFRMQSEYGIGNCLLFSEGCEWLRRDGERYRAPDNLLHAYSYHLQTAEFFGQWVDAYEVWNEVDLPAFWVGTANEYAAYLKAASLALRRGDPGATILISAMAQDPNEYHRAILENDVQGYFDAYNYHSYGDWPAQYDGARKRIELMNEFGIGDVPVWLTETGEWIDAESPHDLPRPVSRRACRHMLKTWTECAAAGVQRTFIFLWWYYMNGKCASILDADNNPTERTAALATANRMLGDANHVGRLNLDEDVHAHLFETAAGPCAILYTGEGPARTVTLEVDAPVETAYMTGEAWPAELDGRNLTLSVGQDPVFVRAAAFHTPAHPTRIQREPARADFPISEVVMDLEFPDEGGYDRGRGAYLFNEGTSREGTMYVYNFGNTAWAGELTLDVEQPWSTSPTQRAVELEPMSRATFPVAVTAPPEAGRRPFFRYAGETDGGRSTLAARVAFRYEDMQPLARAPLLPDLGAVAWESSIFRTAEEQIRRTSEGWRFTFTNRGREVWWAFPGLLAEQAIGQPTFDFSGYEALRLELDIRHIAQGSFFVVILEEPGRVMYGSPQYDRIEPGPTEIVCIFSQMKWLGVSEPDPPEFSLDLDRIAKVHFGINHLGAARLGHHEVLQPGYQIEYELTGIELLRYTPAEFE